MLVDQPPAVAFPDPSGIAEALSAAMATGSVVSLWARLIPNARAVVAADRELSFLALNARCNRLARGLLSLGLKNRSADLIISGGVNIYPAEVETVLTTHPSLTWP
jgi:non-ribosomal peptide synthetase component F